ncbi:SMP-30/gluconolactonase/LRE family protein [bacterium]|nr:MAG: SMP-30/gluconolactonase/LRE family protein [bacterium]
MPAALLLLALLQNSPIAPGAKLIKLADGLSFGEGPARDRKGDVYFTDQPSDRILRWDGNQMTEWKRPAGRSNGTAFDAKGNLIACADEKNELWSISPSGQVTVLLKDFNGKLLNGPNDVWIRKDGAMFFTDPLYVRPYWNRPKESQQPGQYVYFVSPDRKTVRPVATDLKQPNGIVGSPDGKTLYVADIGAGQTFRYRIEKDGTLADKTLFCKLGSDGMSLDNEGNLYLTGGGVTVFDKRGNQIEHIDVPEDWTANVTFGGKDRKMLFITASKGIYGLRMRTKGAD